jgi:hypothetical protein
MKMLIVAVLLVSSSALAAQRYRLDVEVRLGSGQMSKSSIEAQEGEAATFESEDHFFEVVPSARGTAIKLDFVVGVSKDDGARSDVTSTAGLVVNEGQPATVSKRTLENPRQTLTVTVTARRIAQKIQAR